MWTYHRQVHVLALLYTTNLALALLLTSKATVYESSSTNIWSHFSIFGNSASWESRSISPYLGVVVVGWVTPVSGF